MVAFVEAVGRIVEVELSMEIGLGVNLLVMLFRPTLIPLGGSGTFCVFSTGSASSRMQCTLFLRCRIYKARF